MRARVTRRVRLKFAASSVLNGPSPPSRSWHSRRGDGGGGGCVRRRYAPADPLIGGRRDVQQIGLIQSKRHDDAYKYRRTTFPTSWPARFTRTPFRRRNLWRRLRRQLMNTRWRRGPFRTFWLNHESVSRPAYFTSSSSLLRQFASARFGSDYRTDDCSVRSVFPFYNTFRKRAFGLSLRPRVSRCTVRASPRLVAWPMMNHSEWRSKAACNVSYRRLPPRLFPRCLKKRRPMTNSLQSSFAKDKRRRVSAFLRLKRAIRISQRHRVRGRARGCVPEIPAASHPRVACTGALL